jgi:hypothetical protein
VTDNRDTFTVEELIPEELEIELKAKLMGYEVEKIENPNKIVDKTKLGNN